MPHCFTAAMMAKYWHHHPCRDLCPLRELLTSTALTGGRGGYKKGKMYSKKCCSSFLWPAEKFTSNSKCLWIDEQTCVVIRATVEEVERYMHFVHTHLNKVVNICVNHHRDIIFLFSAGERGAARTETWRCWAPVSCCHRSQLNSPPVIPWLTQSLWVFVPTAQPSLALQK